MMLASAKSSIDIIDPTEVQPLPKAIFAVRLDEEGGCAIKRVFQTETHWVLVSDNPEYPPLALEKAGNPHLIIGRGHLVLDQLGQTNGNWH